MDTVAWIFVCFTAAALLICLPFLLTWAIDIEEEFCRAWRREWAQVRASFKRLREGRP